MSLSVLLFGGNGMLGRQLVTAFAGAGHHVTCACRGTTPVDEAAEFITVDRDSPDALKQLAGRSWDVAIDLTSHPGFVRDALGAVDAAHWIYISSASVYARGDIFEPDEKAPIHPAMADDKLDDATDYGAAKSACEAAVERLTTHHLIIRPGLLGGAGDDTGRSGYYPWRFAHPTGPEVVVPMDIGFPLSLLDVTDLANWIVHCAEHRITGILNAAGPTATLGELLDAAQQAAGTKLELLPVDAGLLTDAGAGMWMGPESLPLWAEIPDMPFIGTVGADAARARGLTHQPLERTFADALAFEESRGGPIAAGAAGLSDAMEETLRRLARGD